MTRNIMLAPNEHDKCYSALQKYKAVSAYFTRKHILPFGLAQQYSHVCQESCGRELQY